VSGGPPVEAVTASAATFPTDGPESDGTLEWDATTIVVVEARAGGRTGLGYTYASPAAATVVDHDLAEVVTGRDVLAVRGSWRAMVDAVRNAGRPGIAAHAISAVDVALWDLAAKVVGTAVSTLLGRARDAVEVYGSGGFTSYSEARLREQLGGWAAAGLRAVKMKIGRDPDADPARVAAARDAIGPDTTLMVDANGAYDRRLALRVADALAAHGVTWYEEPVSSDDLDGLRFVRERAPAGLEVTAGEYGYDPWYFSTMLGAGAVDVLQADATRCLGYTGFLAAAELARAAHVPLSFHTAPQLHAHVAVAAPGVRHGEWFHDHVRLERRCFDGVLEPTDGALRPDPGRPGHGLVLRRADLERNAA